MFFLSWCLLAAKLRPTESFPQSLDSVEISSQVSLLSKRTKQTLSLYHTHLLLHLRVQPTLPTEDRAIFSSEKPLCRNSSLCNTAQKSPPPQVNEWTQPAQGHGLLTRSMRISAQAPWPPRGLYQGYPPAHTDSRRPTRPSARCRDSLTTASCSADQLLQQTGAHCVPRSARSWACKVRARPHFEVRITTWVTEAVCTFNRPDPSTPLLQCTATLVQQRKPCREVRCLEDSTQFLAHEEHSKSMHCTE